MIIGLSGEKESGKDTIAAYLVKRYEFERKAFADPMKRSIAALFNIPFKDVDTLKNDKKALVSLTTYPGYRTEMSFRGFLQRYGTESHRDIFGEDFWLEYTLPVGGITQAAISLSPMFVSLTRQNVSNRWWICR